MSKPSNNCQQNEKQWINIEATTNIDVIRNLLCCINKGPHNQFVLCNVRQPAWRACVCVRVSLCGVCDLSRLILQQQIIMNTCMDAIRCNAVHLDSIFLVTLELFAIVIYSNNARLFLNFYDHFKFNQSQRRRNVIVANRIGYWKKRR